MSNILINGDFKVWQRGTSFTNKNLYSADRWITTTKNNISKTDRGILLEPSTDGKIYLRQRIPKDILCFLKGKDITFSAKVKNCSVYLEIYDRLNTKVIGTKDANVNTNGEFKIITKTYKNFTYESNVEYLEFSIIGYTDNLEVEYAKLEIGDIYTENQPESFTEALNRCLPYFEKSYSYETVPGTATFSQCICMYKKYHHQGTYSFSKTLMYKVPKRINNPTLTIYSPNTGAEKTVSIWYSSKWNDLLTDSIPYYTIPYGTGPKGFTLRIKPPSEDKTNIPQKIHSNLNFHYTCDAEIY